MAGPLTGADSPFGTNVKDGAQLAVDQHNAANPGCQVQFRSFDTEGDPQKATAVAPEIVNDESIVGLVGPTWSGRPRRRVRSSTRPNWWRSPRRPPMSASERGWKTFFRGLSNDGVQGPSLANYMKNNPRREEGVRGRRQHRRRQGPGAAIAQTLGPLADSACTISIRRATRTSRRR